MTYIDSLLTTNELVGFRTRQHPLVRLFSAWYGILVLMAGFTCLVFSYHDYNVSNPSFFYYVLRTLAAMFALFGSTVMAEGLLRWRAQDYVVTSRRILKLGGIFTRTATAVSLEKITDLRFHQSRWGRLLDFGDLIILTGAEEEADRFDSLWHAAAFKRATLEAKEDFFHLHRSGPGGRDEDDAGLEIASVLAQSPDQADPEFEHRVRALADLRAQNLISPEQHDAAIKSLLSGNPTGPTSPG